MPDAVLIDQTGPKLYITLNRPEAINALTLDMLRAIDHALDRAEKDQSIRVLILRANGPKGFCAGLDVKLLQQLRASGSEDFTTIFRRLYTIVKRVDTFPKPVISLLDGHCIAAGAQLGTAADIVIVADTLKLVENEMRSGGFMDEQWPVSLGRALGKVRAKRFVLLMETLDGPSAVQLGLATLCVPASELAATGERVADQIASYDPQTVTAVLEQIDRGAGLMTNG
ncbi:MAG: enoyl-CoA hydratase/isomerase family protein [Dehalococcoidia bacterium]|nr:enoyl-CoA hydratase/isomerase family protein [Dehalococcoidia bacterium]